MRTMEDNSRIKNTIRNTLFGVGGQLLSQLLAFVYRTVFIHYLSSNFLGVQGLFSNILSLLSLAELGIGNALTFSMYKPLAQKDTRKVQALMGYYAKAYHLIAGIVAVVGLSLAPFLDFLIKEVPAEINHLQLIYLLYVFDSVASYCLIYKQSIIKADQKTYICTLYTNVFTIIRYIMQMVFLILMKGRGEGSFICILVIQVLFTLTTNIFLSAKASRLYPYIDEIKKERLQVSERKEINNKVRAMMMHKIGSVVVNATDNLLISKFVGLIEVGLYSNYRLLINMIMGIVQQFSQAIVPSIGNLVSLTSKEKSKEIYDRLDLLNFIIYGFCTVCFFTLLNPFIEIWIGKDYLFSMELVCVIVLNFYLNGMRQNVLAFRNALGLFWNDRYKPIIESAINLVVSIMLAKKYGIVGIFLGTLISTITTSAWIEPYILFKNYFKEGFVKYCFKYLAQFFIITFQCFILYKIKTMMFTGTVLSFALLMIVCIMFSIIVFVGIYWHTSEFQYLLVNVKRIIKKK